MQLVVVRNPDLKINFKTAYLLEGFSRMGQMIHKALTYFYYATGCMSKILSERTTIQHAALNADLVHL